MNRNQRSMNRVMILAAAVAAAMVGGKGPTVARGGTSQNSSGDPTAQGNNPAITISFSGQTALRTFSNSAGISTLQPGGSITFNFGSLGNIPITYWASNDPSGYVQLGSKDFTLSDYGLGATSVSNAQPGQAHSALRLEWHEQGSVQGQIDLINDQIGYVSNDGGVTGFISNLNSRGPSASNPTWINGTSFDGSFTDNLGHKLSAVNFANTYNPAVYDLATGRNRSSGSFGGVNGQDRIQFSVGEYKSESLAKNGTPSAFALPGSPGYGLGNPALAPVANTIGLGTAGGRQQLYNEAYANASTDKVDPQSTTSQHYAAGPWNSAGANNIDSKQISVTAVTISANPGTGLTHLNKGDLQWLQTTGRLQNGADFNVVTRANDAGQRIVPAVNSGIDPSWAVGENDDGNTSGTAATDAQKTLGAAFRFSGKTAGGESRNAIAQSRLGLGPLSLAEARGASSNAPVRALDLDWNHLTDTGVASDFVRPTFDSIVNFTYKGVLVSHYNTIKTPRPDLLANYLSTHPSATSEQVQDWWNNLSSAETGIKGDPYGNVAAFINNISNSIGTAAAGTITVASANNPADALFAAGFLIPGLLNYSRQYDGGPLTPNNLSPSQLAVQANVKNNFGPNFTPDGSSGSNAQTVGSNAYYGARNSSTSGTLALNGGTASLLIKAKDAAGNVVANGVVAPKGNYLFGNFNQDGRRDFASVKESVNAALSLHHTDGAVNSIYTAHGGVSNATVVTSLSGSPGWASTANTKGDLIILGDYNSDGRFDGKDVYLLARGASLSDNSSTDHLATGSVAFADAVRNPNAKLNKNAALDYIAAQTNSTTDADQIFLRLSAQNATQAANDPSGKYAFNKADVNRDGRINRADAQIVDYFVGKDYRVLTDQLGAAIATNGTIYDNRTINGSHTNETLAPISLVDAELNDTGNITSVLATGDSDFKRIRDAIQGNLSDPNSHDLLNGDANFDGSVDVADLKLLVGHWQQSVDRWSLGDFDLNGLVDTTDLGLLALSWNSSVPLSAAVIDVGLPTSAVPEPLGLSILTGFTFASLLRRRR